MKKRCAFFPRCPECLLERFISFWGTVLVAKMLIGSQPIAIENEVARQRMTDEIQQIYLRIFNAIEIHDERILNV